MADFPTSDSSPAAPMGTVPAAPAAPAAVAEPTPIDINDDALIRVKGSDKPVKFGDHVKGFQTQFTRASQEAARLKTALAERESRIQQFERERAAAQTRSQGPQTDPLSELRSLPYLNGEQAASVVQAIQGEIGKRDQIILGALKTIQRLQNVVGGLNETHSTAAFDGKINKWLQDGGYPPEASNLAKEIYLAYEGDNLDEEFPQIFANRFEEVERIIEARRAAKVAAARKPAFIPGRGGAANPSKPLEIKGDTNSRDLANQLYGMFEGSET